MAFRKILVVFCAMFLIASTSAFAKTLPNANSAKDLSAKIMDNVVKGNLDAAFKTMEPYTSISPAELGDITIQSKASREKYQQKNGAPLGYEFIDSRRVGDSLLMLRYIEKSEKHILLWEFYFYNTKAGWILDSFNWNDAYRSLFESSKK